MIVKLRRKECETPKERAQPCLEVGMQVLSAGSVGAQRRRRRCVRKGMQVRYAVGAGTHRCGRRCVGLVAWVREGGAVVYSGGGGAGVGARYSILGVNRNQSELIGIYRRISDKL